MVLFDMFIFIRPVAPPRGERGLKYQLHNRIYPVKESLPLVGSVD